MGIGIGDLAPDFSLPSQSGEIISLHDFIGKKNVVLYFYPRDFTRSCTAEAHAFRESYSAITAADSEVIGVSSDSIESHKRFSETCGLPFEILSDKDSKVRLKYGVNSPLGIVSTRFTGRTTFIIDKAGFVRLTFTSQFQPTKHVAEALKALSDGSLG